MEASELLIRTIRGNFMKHFAVTSFILLRASVLYAIDIPTATYDVRPAEGNLFALDVFKSKLWEGRKHTFVFDRFRGSLSFNQEQPERSTAQFVVESASARCTDDWVKPHQIKDIEKAAIQDTMAAAQFPEITFHSTTIQAKSSGQYEVRGLLTIRDQTKPVALIVKAAPREGGIWVEGSGQIRLSDFGLKPPRAVAGVGLFIGTKDEMTVQFALLASPTDK
jgi:polyisoprenoid-binding protein YceI